MKYPPLVPRMMCKTDISVVIDREGLSEDGAPLTAGTWSGKCNYQDVAKKLVTKDKQEVQITGQAYIPGDICPDAPEISAGSATVFGSKRKIAQGMKARNPDGTVNYTRLDVM